jgi:replicative DNA helicase
MVTSERDVGGEEFVGSFAERLSAIECRRSKPIRSLAEIAFARLERREEIQKHPELLQAWPTGYGVLDALTGGFRPGHLWTLAARPGVGKTAFVVSMLEHLAGKGVPVGMFVLEDYADAVADRTLMREGGIGSTFMRDTCPWGKETWNRAAKAVQKVSDWPVYVDDQHGRTIHDIAGTMRRMARDKGVRVFVLDNLSEVAIDRQDRGEERLDRALGRIAKVYRDAAHAVGACPVLIVHLNREVEKRQGQPRMSDLKNSGEIEDASHVVAMLTREKDSEVMNVDVVKNRAGPTGEVTLTYDRQYMAVRNPRAA